MDRMKELTILIKKYDKAYESGKPLITDTEYDKLYKELVDLEKQYGVLPNSPTTYIENAKINHLKKVKHLTPMLSQEKCHTKEEIIAFTNRVNDNKYIVDLKLDGISIALKYKNGLLKQAVTRGNGHTGYDITAAALKMDGVPKKLNQDVDIEVRGEVIMQEADFEALNTDGEYSNSRNFVAGTLNALDTNLVKERRLFVCTYDIRSYKNILGQQMSTEEAHNLLQALGFMVVKHWIFKSNELNEMIKFCETFNKKIRPTIECKIDGLVIKANDNDIIKKLGNTSKFPKASIAYKFDSQDRTTILKSVDWQVGRTGQLTPVANFDTIEIDGVEINKASLSNIENINKLDIKIGDTIVVARSNDVIPKIISVIKDNRNGNEIDISIPNKCPVCGGSILQKGPITYCNNNNCSAKIISKIVHFAERDAMNIEDLSDKTVEAIINAGIPCEGYEDLYLLHNYKNELENIERFGKKKVSNILSEIEKSKNNYLHQLIYGLGIPNIGLSKAKAISSLYNNLDELVKDIIDDTFLDKISKLPDFGDIVVKSVDDWLDDYKYLLLAFDYMGPFNSEKINIVSNNMSGKTIVITGELSKPRKEIEKELKSLGIKVSSSVSKNIDYLLVGDNNQDTSSNKYKNAIKNNITIIEESDFRKLF